MKSKKASSFHEFARNTSDAWDIGDDEDEDFTSSSSSLQTLNSKVAKATAAQVLENHSKLRVKPERVQPTLSDMPTNCKVNKSSSEAQLSRMSGKSCLQEQLLELNIVGTGMSVLEDPVFWALRSFESLDQHVLLLIKVKK